MAKRNDPLIEAIKGGKTVPFLMLKDRASNLNETGSEGITPLIATIKYDQWVMFLQLVSSKRVDVNQEDEEGKTALSHAVESDRFTYQLFLQDKSAI